MIKSGGIFPLLATIPALIAAAAPAVAKTAALGAVGTAAGMALKKVTGKGYRKRGGNIFAALPALIAALAKSVFSRPDVRRMFPLAASFSGSGYKKGKRSKTTRNSSVMVSAIKLPASNFDLLDAVKKLNINHFRGVFMRDQLPARPNNKETGIINLDKKNRPWNSLGCLRDRSTWKYLYRFVRFSTTS